jgi:hypothetical protein
VIYKLEDDEDFSRRPYFPHLILDDDEEGPERDDWPVYK